MPWEARRDDRCPVGKPFGVSKKDANRTLVTCHDTKDKADAHVRALYANSPDAGGGGGSTGGHSYSMNDTLAAAANGDPMDWLFALAELPDVSGVSPTDYVEGQPIQILPAVGRWKNPRYGDIDVTEQMQQEFVDNFEANVRGQRLPIGVEHMPAEGAVGRLKSVFRKGVEGVFAIPEWTGRGAQFLKEKRFGYISPEFYRQWEHPQTGVKHTNVLAGAAVTNNPFFKGMQEVMLSETLAPDVPATTTQSEPLEVTMPNEAELPAGDTQAQPEVNAAEGGTPQETPTPTPTPDPTPDPAPEPTPSPASVVQTTEPAPSAELVSLGERLQATELALSQERHERRLLQFREEFSEWSGDRDENAALMLTLNETVSPELYTQIRTRIDTLEGQVRASALFSERGSTQPAETSPEGILNAEVQRLMAADPSLSKSDALVQAAELHPEAYREYGSGIGRAAQA